MAGITSLTFDPLLIQACIAQIMAGHLKMQTIQTEYFFLILVFIFNFDFHTVWLWSQISVQLYFGVFVMHRPR